MRFFGVISLLAMGVAIVGCTTERGRSASREAGRDAYKVQQEGRKAAKKIGRELKEAGKEAREGWHEASREAKPRDKE